jgi:hypothetical protein
MYSFFFFFVCVGATDIGGVGVDIAIFNQASRITMYPIVSITTSFVAEEDTMDRSAIEAQKVEGKKLENLEEASPKNVEMQEPSPKNGALSLSLSYTHKHTCRRPVLKRQKQEYYILSTTTPPC